MRRHGGGGLRDGRAEYYCRTIGCVRIPQRDVDDIAESVLLDYLARPQVIDTLRAADTTTTTN